MFSDKTIVGLDIGSESIKLAEVHHYSNRKELRTYGVAHHDIDTSGYWDRQKLRSLSVIIQGLQKAGDFKGIKTVMSVPSKDVFVTTMDFEAHWKDAQIQSEIEKQAEYFLPLPPEDMRLSWQRINEDSRISEYTGKQKVIINALPEFILENSKNLLEHLNLDGVALENQTVSQIRASLSPDKGNTLLVDIGGSFTTLSIIVDDVLRASMHVNIGIDKIDEDISGSLGVPLQNATQFRKDLSLINLFELPTQITQVYQTLKSEIDTFVELNRKVSQPPHKIVITGGGSSSVGLLEYFKDYPVKVYPAGNLRHVAVPPVLRQYIAPIEQQLATAIGLSLRDDI